MKHRLNRIRAPKLVPACRASILILLCSAVTALLLSAYDAGFSALFSLLF